MEKTYTQKVHFKIVIEGDYSCGNMWEEELYQNAEDALDDVCNHVAVNLIDYYQKANIELSNLRTVEEN